MSTEKLKDETSPTLFYLYKPDVMCDVKWSVKKNIYRIYPLKSIIHTNPYFLNTTKLTKSL